PDSWTAVVSSACADRSLIESSHVSASVGGDSDMEWARCGAIRTNPNTAALVANHGPAISLCQKTMSQRGQGREVEALRILKVSNIESDMVEHGYSNS
ncbi:MAG: hypothetical protein ACLP1W_20150, partial [Rhodomicrobium sp.]